MSEEWVKDVDVDVIFEIGRTRKEIREIVKWERGTQIKLDQSVVNQLNVFVNNQLIAHGSVLRDDDGEMSVKITKKAERGGNR